VQYFGRERAQRVVGRFVGRARAQAPLDVGPKGCGSQYVANDFQRELTFLGIASSPSFVRAPEGNGCAERIIRTLKEQLLWVQGFADVEALRAALEKGRQLYNTRWLIERHGHRAPAQVRQEWLIATGRGAS
jgi:transposase InsO family protein